MFFLAKLFSVDMFVVNSFPNPVESSLIVEFALFAPAYPEYEFNLFRNCWKLVNLCITSFMWIIETR